jgi:hypothetical protein
MPASNKVGTQLLLSPHVKTRGQALAVVRQESVAEIWRIAIEGGGLAQLEMAHTGALAHLQAAFDRQRVDKEGALQAMIDQRIRYADLFLPDGTPRSRFPGTIR